MISVPIDRIVPLTDARDNFSRLVVEVESMSDGLYVLTKGGKPAIALINIKYLEEVMVSKQPATGELASGEKHDGSSLPKLVTNIEKTVTPNEKLKASLNFEPPKFNQSPSIPIESPKPTNYDVKPVINPTWTGEKPKEQSSAPLSAPNKPLDSARDKPPINPWPIIPPRPMVSRDTSATTVPPRQSPIAEPLAPSQNPIPTAPALKPIASSPSTPRLSSEQASLGVNQLPVAPPTGGLPKMVAPPPPPPPSPLPNIPSSFQVVPVPINGGSRQSAINNQQSANIGSPAESRELKAESSAPSVPLPPPPVTSTPAPFSSSGSFGVNQSSGPSVAVTPKPTNNIIFDQPPTTILEPGEELSAPSGEQPVANPPTPSSSTPSDANRTAATNTIPPSSVKDLEI